MKTWTDDEGAIHTVIPAGKINRSSKRARILAKFLFARDNSECCYCGVAGAISYDEAYASRLDVLEIDHIIPRRDGGSNHPGNLQLLCSKCNKHKTALERIWRENEKQGTPNDYREWVLRWMPEAYAECVYNPGAWPVPGVGGLLHG